MKKNTRQHRRVLSFLPFALGRGGPTKRRGVSIPWHIEAGKGKSGKRLFWPGLAEKRMAGKGEDEAGGRFPKTVLKNEEVFRKNARAKPD